MVFILVAIFTLIAMASSLFSRVVLLLGFSRCFRGWRLCWLHGSNSSSTRRRLWRLCRCDSVVKFVSSKSVRNPFLSIYSTKSSNNYCLCFLEAFCHGQYRGPFTCLPPFVSIKVSSTGKLLPQRLWYCIWLAKQKPIQVQAMASNLPGTASNLSGC